MADEAGMPFDRDFHQPAPLEALFRSDTVRFEYAEDEEDHNAFVMSLSQLALSLQEAASSAQVQANQPSQM